MLRLFYTKTGGKFVKINLQASEMKIEKWKELLKGQQVKVVGKREMV
tara:strand:+ start:624 stop:764 length:141 start_codon:yes stop_codon:yes gene_type:complete